MKNYFLVAILIASITRPLFSQKVGGRGNSEISPKSVEASSLNAGSFSGDVNIFSGEYNASISLGSVATPGGIDFSLSLNYNSSYTVGGSTEIARGVPYGDGWSLNIPTISIETDVFTNFSISKICEENNAYYTNTNDLINFNASGVEKDKEGDIYWFSPHINIPGVASGRAVFKYVDVSDDKAAVFVLNSFESYAEIRFYTDHWTVQVNDGTKYHFSTALKSTRAPSNMRTLFYDQNESTPRESEVLDQDLANELYNGVVNSILPKVSFTTWFCDRISHSNLPEQSVNFIYETYGEYNYFQEFLQEFANDDDFKTSLGDLTLQTINSDLDFTAYTDILLKEVNSFAIDVALQKLKLNYKTNNEVLGSNPYFFNFHQSDVSRLDSLYSFKTIYYAGINDEFTDWKRYNHVKSSIGSTSNFASHHNPYLSTSGYNRTNVSGEAISFSHGFLESPRISQNLIYPGDIYEVKTILNREIPSSADVATNGGTFDISVLTGTLGSSPSSPNEHSFSYFDNGSSVISNTDYESTRGVELFSTFNQGVKWTFGKNQAIKSTSNFFMMPDFPDAYEGIQLQIGPGNSDNNFAADVMDIGDLIATNENSTKYIDAKRSYAHQSMLSEFLFKSAATIPHNFGIGLGWSNLIPLYDRIVVGEIDENDNRKTYDGWWLNSSFQASNPDLDHAPTKADENVSLNEIQLIRYAKNPFMLESVEFYVMNGEVGQNNESGWKLGTKKQLEYTVKNAAIFENYDYQENEDVIMNNNKFVSHILLSTVREVPTDYDGTDSLKTLPTFLEYARIKDDGNPSNDFVYKSNAPYNEYIRYTLVRFQDQLGGVSVINYHTLNDSETYCTYAYQNNQNCNSLIFTKPFGVNNLQTVHLVVDAIYKEDERNLIANDTYSTTADAKKTEYHFDVSSRKGMQTNFALNNEHFRNRDNIRFNTGFGKAVVHSPELSTTGEKNITEYLHFTHDSGTQTLEEHLYFGKLKSAKSYDDNMVLHSEELFTYGNIHAFQNGYLRPNLYRSQLNYDERDYDRLIHPYEYEDYYKDEPLTVSFEYQVDSATTAYYDFIGTDAYELIDIPSFFGNESNFIESPKFLEFEYFEQINQNNPDYYFDSYFVKLLEKKERVYDDYQYIDNESIITEVTNGTFVEKNPFGNGKVNPAGDVGEVDEDIKAIINNSSSSVSLIMSTLEEKTPLSEQIIEITMNHTKLDSQKKTTILELQHGLSNNMWIKLLNLESQFSPQNFGDLIDQQSYFTDTILKHLVDINHSNFDQTVFTAFFKKRDTLSHDVKMYLINSSGFTTSIALESIFTDQNNLLESELIAIINSSNCELGILEPILHNDILTTPIYQALLDRSDMTINALANIISNSKLYPENEILIEIIHRTDISEKSDLMQILASSKQGIDDIIDAELRLYFSEEDYDKIKVAIVTENSLNNFCMNEVISTRSYIETKTTFEYYDADYNGATTSKGYQALFGFEQMPRTIDLTEYGIGTGSKTFDSIYLKHQPSWNLFSKKVSSPQLPHAYQEEQYFYLYDLKNRYDRYWFNYGTQDMEFQIYSNSEELTDTLGVSDRWMLAPANPTMLPKFDGMIYSQQHEMRDLPFQKTNISKIPNNPNSIQKSEYYHYDNKWEIDLLPVMNQNLAYDGPTCEEEEDPDPVNPCGECYNIKYITEQAALALLQDDFCLWKHVGYGYYFCPSSYTAPPCDLQATKIECMPLSPEDPNYEDKMLTPALVYKHSLFLRKTYTQVDTVKLNPNAAFSLYRLDDANTYVADFIHRRIKTPTEDGPTENHEILLPFDALRSSKIIERNRYGQVQVEEDQTGMKTRYYYQKPEWRRYVDTNCTDPLLVNLYNISTVYSKIQGLPYRVTVGFDRSDSLSTAYEYNDLNLVQKVTQPSGHSLSYSYDGFNRLTKVMENETRLLARTSYHYWDRVSTANFDQRTGQNYVFSIAYNQYAENDTNNRVLSKKFVDPLGRAVAETKNYGTNYLYSPTTIFDNWGRAVKTFKSSAEIITSGDLLYKKEEEGPFMETKLENTPKNRFMKSADFDESINGDHTIRKSYTFINNVIFSCELDLSKLEIDQVLKQANTDGFRIVKTITRDQDDKNVIEYANAAGQKLATVTFDATNNQSVTLFVYDVFGNVKRVINPEKQITDYEYNMLGLLVREKTIDSGEKRFMYNKFLQVSASQDEVEREHVRMDEETSISQPVIRKFDYDDYGRLIIQKEKPVSSIYNPFTYEDKLIAAAYKTPISLPEGDVYFDYHFSFKSSLDWLYCYHVWNGAEIIEVGPGKFEDIDYESNFAVDKQQGNDHVGNAPEARDDLGYTTQAETAIEIPIILNDIDIDSDLGVDDGNNNIDRSTIDLLPEIIGVQSELSTTEGGWVVNNNGTVTFTPTPNFVGTTSTQYLVSDFQGNPSNFATIEVSVTDAFYFEKKEKSWVYGTNPSVNSIGKLVASTSYSNNGLPIQEITYNYNSEDRLSEQTTRFHPYDLSANTDVITSKIYYPNYNFAGSLLDEKVCVNFDPNSENNEINLHQHYEYDALNRLTEVHAGKGELSSIGMSNLVARYSYDDATGAMVKEEHFSEGVHAQNIYSSYDVRNRLIQLSSELLRYDLFYDNQSIPQFNGESVEYTENYNGNINGIKVKYLFGDSYNAPTNFEQPTIYGYTYDKSNRLTKADAIVGNFVLAATSTQVEESYLIGDEVYAYDKIGNITSLMRYLKDETPGLMTQMQGFTYNYLSGTNQLITAEGMLGTTNRNYTYDKNGNLLTDDYKELEVAAFGRGSYPYQLTKENQTISYLYDVNDLRIYKSSTEEGISKVTYSLKDAANRDVAIYDAVAETWSYQIFGNQLIAKVDNLDNRTDISMQEITFSLYDHLGNTRVQYRPNSIETETIMDENENPISIQYTQNEILYAGDYFPYGKVIREFTQGELPRYVSTHHERDAETGLDYRGARYYDSDIARFLSIDPWQAKYPNWSTYNYVMGNPIKLIDPTGQGPTPPMHSEYLLTTGLLIFDYAISKGASTNGALLVMAQAVKESGWDGSSSNYNLFGIMADKGEASNGKTAHGKVKDYTNSGQYKGSLDDYYSKLGQKWPKMLEVIKASTITATDIDKALNTGNYIPSKDERNKGKYAYNFDFGADGKNHYGTSLISQMATVKRYTLKALSYKIEQLSSFIEDTEQLMKNYWGILSLEYRSEQKVLIHDAKTQIENYKSYETKFKAAL